MSNNIMYPMDTIPPTNPMIIICRAGIFLINFANRAKRTNRSSLTAPCCPPIPGKRKRQHNYDEVKVIPLPLSPNQYRHGAAPSARTFATTSKINMIKMT